MINKDEIRDEFAEFCHQWPHAGKADYPTYNEIADYWLNKIQEMKSDLVGKIDKKAKERCTAIAKEGRLENQIEELNIKLAEDNGFRLGLQAAITIIKGE